MNRTQQGMSLVLAGALCITPLAGCQDLPGSPGAQGAVIGGAGGAATGALLSKDNRLLGALIGGAVGAGGGYLIGANMHKIRGQDKQGAEEANQQAQASPATAEQAKASSTADINADGYVTADEIIAMSRAGLSDQVILDRLRASGQVFELTATQRDMLVNNGVSRYVVDSIEGVNADKRQQLLRESELSPGTTTETIGRPPR